MMPIVDKKTVSIRRYIQTGSVHDFSLWLDKIHSINPGGFIPFQWIAPYVGVSDEAVHKRLRTGRITLYTFLISSDGRRRKRALYDYALISECQQWRDERKGVSHA